MNNCGASSSNPPPPPPPQEAASSLLAPGFRFHPTDEELVIYYLKRKVFGKPLRVEAIAEVDLYKAEPWDLPALSRLRSRDMEWYFFSPLDRKYANRSRTNRATSQGYWKTTGKDRPVHHGPRTVGMKKTLVFHVGRAPRGERTNWVMHEYRLEDEELARAGIPQDSFVVCRIFQKSGTGPQNGAQYGAPFIEDEWEEEVDNMAIAVVDGGSDSDNMPLAPVIGGDTVVVGAGNGEYLQLSDFDNRDMNNEHEIGGLLAVNYDGQNDMNNEHEIGGLLAVNFDGQNIGSRPEDDPIFLVDGIFEDPILVNNMHALGPLGAQTLDDHIGGNTDVAVQTHSPSQNDGYLELNDLRDTVKADYPSSEDSVGCVLGECNGQMSHNCGFESNNLPERLGAEQFFDTVNESNDSPVVFPTFQDDFYLEPNEMNYIFGDYPSDHAAEDNLVFYDASSNDLPVRHDNFVQMDEVNPPIAGSSGFYLVDDIMTYFDNTDNNLHSTMDSSEKFFVDSSVSDRSNFAPEVGSSVPTYKAPSQTLEANVVASSVKLPGSSNLPNDINENVAGAPDSQGQKGCDGTLKKRLMNHLGSYSAPPALASDCPALLGKSFGQISSTNSASSVHVTAGMIQIHGFEVIGRAKHWSLHKNGDMRFLLSCGIASNEVSKSDCFEPITKMHSWSLSVVLRGGLFLFFLSGMFLALCFKAGMHAYCS